MLVDRLEQFNSRLSSNQRFAVNIVVPFLYFIPLGVAYFSPKNFGFGFRFLVYAGLGIGAMGLLLWIVSMFNLGSSFAVLPGSNRLATRGIYRYIRHPMYWGIVLTLFGLLLACGSLFGMVYLAVIVLPLNVIRSRLEERALLKQFGEHYRRYLASTLL